MKKCLTFLLSVAFCISGFSQITGDGTVDSPFIIIDTEGLAFLADIVNSGEDMEEAFFALGADIICEESYLHTPIGKNSSNPFQATFDGAGYKIVDLNVYQTASNAGLFGYLGDKATVKNLVLAVDKGGSIQGAGTLGSIAAVCEGVIENCYNYLDVATVSFGGSVAGLVGQLRAGGSIIKCYNAGNVYGGSGVITGGIVGSNGGIIDQCFNVGTVISESRRVGGIAGLCDTSISNCFNAGLVRGEQQVGGIVGHSAAHEEAAVRPSLANCYNVGQIVADFSYGAIGGSISGDSGNEMVGPTIENCYYDKQMYGFSSKGEGKLTTEMAVATAYEGFDTSIWSFTEGEYPSLVALGKSDAASLATSVAWLYSNNDNYDTADNLTHSFSLNSTDTNIIWSSDGFGLKVKGDKVIVRPDTTSITPVTLTGSLGNATRELSFEILPGDLFSGGSGTEADPYKISSVDDLEWMSYLYTNGETFADTYLVMTNNIECKSSDETYVHTPIGKNGATGFRGVFDGSGYEIVDLTINSTSSNAGLFGYIEEGGVVKNLGLTIKEGGAISGTSSVGSIAGYSNGSIENCYNYLPVFATGGNAGGLVGALRKTGSILRSYNAGNVSNSGNTVIVGGIVGSNLGIVEECLNIGTVTNNGSQTGGISGSLSGYILNSVNAGLVIGGNTEVGGLSGRVFSSREAAVTTAYIRSSYSIGQVVSTGTRGALVGVNQNNPDFGVIGGEFYDNYYDKQMFPFGAIGGVDVDGTTGLMTTELTTATALTGLDGTVWSFKKDEYPSLTVFGGKDVVSLAVSPAFLYVTEADYDTADGLSHSFSLASADAKIVWSSDAFGLKVKGDKVVVRPDTVSVTSGILTGSLGNATRELSFDILPGDLFSGGSGTEADPYKISSVDDLEWMSYLYTNGETFADTYLIMTNNIECKTSDETYIHTPIGKNGATGFRGVFDGSGYEIVDLTINSTSSNAGLFGYIEEGGVVKNLGLTIKEGGAISGTSSVGSIAGYSNGSIENCYNYLPVFATGGNAGGLVGALRKTGSILKSYNAGNVSNSGNTVIVGGIVGSNLGIVEECLNIGTVTNNGSQTGGIAGSMSGYILNSVNAGLVIGGNTEVGGLAGRVVSNSREAVVTTAYIRSSYSVGQVIGSSMVGALVGQNQNNPDFGVIGGEFYDSYYDKQMFSFGAIGGVDVDGTTGLMTTELTTATALTGLDGTVWSFKKDEYPSLTVFGGKDVVSLAVSPAFLYVTETDYDTADGLSHSFSLASADVKIVWSSDAFGLKVKGDKVIVRPDTVSVTSGILTGSLGNATRELSFDILPGDLFSGGSGTEADPYKISSVDDLEWVSDLSVTGETFADAYLVMTNNIECKTSDEMYVHTPIGKNSATGFRGIFDGSGYEIVDLTINSTSSNAGLFGNIEEGGVVKNLGLTINEGGSVSGTSIVGSIAGYNKGLIENCYNYLPVTGTLGTVGGLVGSIRGTGSVVRSYNAGSVSNSGSVITGGISGGNLGVIKECLNIGTVSNESAQTGGISGSLNGYILNSVNAGLVIGDREVGGLAGRVSSSREAVVTTTYIRSSYSVGQVIGSSMVGALVGQNQNNPDFGVIGGDFYDTYYDKQMFVFGAIGGEDVDGTTGLLTTDFATATALTNFDASVWTFTNNVYPSLTALGENDAVKVASAPIFLSVEGDEYDTVETVSEEFTVSSIIDWSSDSEAIVVEEGKVTLLPKKDEDQEAVLVGTSGNVSKTINLIVLEGEPINSVEDMELNGISIYSVANGVMVSGLEAGDYKLYSVAGYEIGAGAIHSSEHFISLSAKGIYIIKIATEDSTKLVKFIF